MTKENYQKLKEKIIEAVPSIMELKFGCKILRYKDKPDERKYMVINDIGYAANEKKIWINSVPFGAMQLPIEILKSEIGDETGDWMIIGRDIRLADIIETYGGKYSLATDKIWKDNLVRISAGVDIGWNLKKNNLDDQLDDTKQFLFNLLCE